MSSIVSATQFKIKKVKQEKIKKYCRKIFKEEIGESTGTGKWYFHDYNISILYVALEGDKIIGWSFAGKKEKIVAVYVHPTYRNRGIGRDLLTKLSKKLSDDSYIIKPFLKTEVAVEKILETINKDIKIV